MATEVFTTEEITLLDGTLVELRPLPIGKMRKVMKIWFAQTAAVSKKYKEATTPVEGSAEISVDGEVLANLEAELQDSQYDVLVSLCKIGLEDQLKGEKTERQWTDYLENTLDDATIARILLKTANLRIGENAPNPTTP